MTQQLNNNNKTWGYMNLFKLGFSPDICPGVESLDHMETLFSVCFFFNFIGVQLFHDVGLVSTVQQSGSNISVHVSFPSWPPSQTLHPSSSPLSTKLSSYAKQQVPTSYLHIYFPQCLQQPTDSAGGFPFLQHLLLQTF